MSEKISYLRKGRKLRCSGVIVSFHATTKLTKVKPSPPSWKHVMLTTEEILAGREKPEHQPRKKPAEPKERKPRQPKAPKKPRWQQLVDEVRTLEADHHPDAWPTIRMATISELANELEKAHHSHREFLPILNPTKQS